MAELLNISNVQHFSVGDGDGIRTTVFFKGCELCCPWCHNPENLGNEPVTMRFSNGTERHAGRFVTAEELLPELMEDIDFYRESRGGVTFSGGEVMLQAKGACELAELLHKNGVSVLIDTAGCVPYRSFERLNEWVFGYLFDFKTADSRKYAGIGGDLTLVTDNICRLRADGANVTIRIPLIPDFNTDGDSIADMCRVLCDMEADYVELLPFHRLGSSKYEALGLDYAYRNRNPLTEEQLAFIESEYAKYFKVKIER